MRAPPPAAAAAEHILQNHWALLRAARSCNYSIEQVGVSMTFYPLTAGCHVHMSASPAAAVAAEDLRQTHMAVLHAARPGILRSMLDAGPYGRNTC